MLVFGVLSTSMSFANRDAAVIIFAVSSGVDVTSSTATGASLTAVTVIVTSPVSVSEPSDIV